MNVGEEQEEHQPAARPASVGVYDAASPSPTCAVEGPPVTATAATTPTTPPLPYPHALPRASLRFAHAPELLLFALDLAREASLPATRNPSAAASSSAAAAPPIRYDALASVALLIARAKSSLLPPPPSAGTSSSTAHRHHRFGLLACRGPRAEYVPGSLCADPARLETALSRLREEALAATGGDNENDTAPFEFTSLADAAAEAVVARDASSGGSASSASFGVRVVLLFARSRPPAPLTREDALKGLWRQRASLPSLHVDVLYAYDPSSSTAARSATEAAAATAETTPPPPASSPQQVFSRLEACIDALSAAAPHALLSSSSSSASATAALDDAARRNHSYVLDVSIFAPRRLLGAACQLLSHPLQRPALARPSAARDLAVVRSVPLPSELGSRKAAQQQEQREREQREREAMQAAAAAAEEEDGDGDSGDASRDEWGLPLVAAADPSSSLSPPPLPASSPPGGPLLVDITDQMGRLGVTSFPVAASGHDTDEDGGDTGGARSPAAASPSPWPAPTPPPPPAV